MISRPIEELSLDYGGPSEALKAAGFFASMLYDVDGLRFSPTAPFVREATLLLIVRQRGLFVRSHKGKVYRAPDGLDATSLCIDLMQELVARGPSVIACSDFFRCHDLQEVSSWEDDERQERDARFQAYGWVEVDDEGAKRIWNEFETQIGPEHKPAPSPSVTWDIRTAYAENLSTDTEPDLTRKALAAMRAVSARDEVWHVFADYAALSNFLPWRADARPYKFWWKHPILPRDAPPRMNVRTNHNCFVRQDFRAGFLTYLREDSLCVFGQDLLDALAEDPPLLLTKVRRRNGIPV